MFTNGSASGANQNSRPVGYLTTNHSAAEQDFTNL